MGPGDDFEIFDAPDMKARDLAYLAIVPRRLGLCGAILDFVINVGADELDIAVLDVIFLQVRQSFVWGHVVVLDDSTS